MPKKDKQKTTIEIITCPDCEGNKIGKDNLICSACNGKGVYLKAKSPILGERVYYWQEKISGFSPFLRKIAFLIPKIIQVILVLIIISFILTGLKFVFDERSPYQPLISTSGEIVKEESGAISSETAKTFSISSSINPMILITRQNSKTLMFWLGILGLMYLYYSIRCRDASEKEIDFSDEKFRIFLSPSREELGTGDFPFGRKANYLKKSKNNPVNISDYISSSARKTILMVLDTAHSLNQAPHPFHLMKVLLNNPKTETIFKRLEIKTDALIGEIENKINELPKNSHYQRDGILSATIPSPDLERLVLSAFTESLIMGFKKIRSESLFLALVKDKATEKMFKDREIEIEDARNTVLWATSWSGIKVKTKKPRKVEHRIMNTAWTARVTPELDQYSYDMTDLARAGVTGYIVDRKKEVNTLMRIMERTSQNNALLIGEVGSGRMTIVKELANRMIKDNVLPSLRDKRLVVLDIGSLVAGARAGGDLEERILNALEDMSKSGNIILVIPNIHNIAAAGSGEGFDASKIFSPILARGIFQIIGTTDYANYHRYIEPRGDFSNNFDLIKVEELDEKKTMEVMAVQAKLVESREGVIITFGALKKAVELSKRYITDRLLPGKAIDLLSETAVLVRNRGANAVLRDNDIMQVITEKTGIPLTNVSANEAEKLLKLEKQLHRRVIGQLEAIKAVSAAIRRVRVGLKKENRPIGTFLFIGPTGVGKTELAKALAEAYYGNEKAMVRLDMSEYQTVASVEKLIGSSSNYDDANTGGQLTEAIKRKPYSLVLLDELEKANKNVLNLFLQVFDDGRLTDSLGRTVDFTNTIIIATSNAGSKVVSKMYIDEESSSERMIQMLEPYLLKYFTPEFLNRFTAKVVFKSLSKKDIIAIAKLQLNNLAQRLEKAQGITLLVSDEAVDKIAHLGYSSQYGARFLQRTIQEKIENLIATKFLKGEIKRGEEFVVEAEDI